MRRSFLSGSVSAWALCTGWFVSSLFVTGSAESQDFPRPIVSAAPGLSSSLIDLTYSPSRREVYVISSSQTVIHNEPLSANPVVTTSPSGTMVGIAADPRQGNTGVFWLVGSGAQLSLFRANLIGQAPSLFCTVPVLPTTAVVGIDVDDSGSLLFVNDQVNGLIATYDIANLVGGAAQFINACPKVGPGLSWGVSHRRGTIQFVDVASNLAGPIPFPSNLLTLDVATCSPIDLSGHLIPNLNPLFWITAIDHGPFGASGFRSMYMFDLASNQLMGTLISSTFIRGDCNSSAAVDLSDMFHVAGVVAGTIFPPCQDACDVDGSGLLDNGDFAFITNFLFFGGPRPPAPFPSCGYDPVGDLLTCDSSGLCP